jgi:hypothetical protein
MNYQVGEWVEVRSKEEILKTLDKKGQLEGLPFMPQMFQYCGKRFRVFKRAHKTCDTINDYKTRKMHDAVHLEGIRCDGQAFGGCDAACLIFWKEAWLEKTARLSVAISISQQLQSSCVRVFQGGNTHHSPPSFSSELRCKAVQNKDDIKTSTKDVSCEEPRAISGCMERDVWSGTRAIEPGENKDLVYVCQATQLLAATEPLSWWNVRQYAEDLVSGNVGLVRMVCGFIYMTYYSLVNAGIGLGSPLRWLYDGFQRVRGGVPYPRRQGRISEGKPTPITNLNLQPGEWVRIKSYNEILATLDINNKNRGLYFDAEMAPYCGRSFRVVRCVKRILDEKTGRIMEFKNPCVILEGAVCEARYSNCRMFCPRSIYAYWREIWLERVPTK